MTKNAIVEHVLWICISMKKC